MADTYDVEYGFYNSLNGDRRYNTMDFARLFDSLLSDGVFLHYGGHFGVSDARLVEGINGMQVYINTGRAWFNHTWSYSDVVIVRDIAPSSNTYSRIDTVVLEVNSQERSNHIKVITGEAKANPTPPSLFNSSTVHQYPLADVTVNAGATYISLLDIRNRIGTTDCPWATSLLDGEVDSIITQALAEYLDDDGSALYRKLAQYAPVIVAFHIFYRGDVSCSHTYQELKDLTDQNRPLISILIIDDQDPQSDHSYFYCSAAKVESERNAVGMNSGHIEFDFITDSENGVIRRCGYDGISDTPFGAIVYTKPTKVYFRTNSLGAASCSHTFQNLKDFRNTGRDITAIIEVESASGRFVANDAKVTYNFDPNGQLIGIEVIYMNIQPAGTDLEDWGWYCCGYAYDAYGLRYWSNAQ